MGYKNARAKATDGYGAGSENYVAANSLDASVGTLISLSGGYAAASGAGTDIVGVSVTSKVFAADNQTVAMDKVTINPTKSETVYEMPITGGTITAAKVGKFYNITATQVVDGATESATVGKLQLVKFISATRGQFKIVNK